MASIAPNSASDFVCVMSSPIPSLSGHSEVVNILALSTVSPGTVLLTMSKVHNERHRKQHARLPFVKCYLYQVMPSRRRLTHCAPCMDSSLRCHPAPKVVPIHLSLILFSSKIGRLIPPQKACFIGAVSLFGRFSLLLSSESSTTHTLRFISNVFTSKEEK